MTFSPVPLWKDPGHNVWRNLGFILLCCTLCGCSLLSFDGGSTMSGGVRGTKTYTVRGKTYTPLISAQNFYEEGIASWYGNPFHGRLTANGERYNMYELTAAHKLLPFGTRLRVTSIRNGRTVIVRINDRGPFIGDRIIDLSYTAAKQLDMLGKGTARVRLQAIDTGNTIANSGKGNARVKRDSSMFEDLWDAFF